MSSRGRHIEGTDGTDFQHRQQVSPTHTTSARYKRNLNLCMHLHLALVIILCHCMIGDKIHLKVPLWFWFYLPSLFAEVPAYYGIRSNSCRLLWSFVVLIFGLSICPMLHVNYEYFSEAMYHFSEPSPATSYWTVIYTAIAILAFFMHSFQCFAALRLIYIWKSGNSTKSN